MDISRKDKIQKGLEKLIEGPEVGKDNPKILSQWYMTVAQGLLEVYLCRKSIGGMYVSLSEHWLGRAESIAFDYVTAWGYGQVEVYMAVEECARSFEEALESEFRKNEELPGVAAYEIDFDAAHPKKFNNADPIQWYTELSSLAPKIVNDWVYDVRRRMK